MTEYQSVFIISATAASVQFSYNMFKKVKKKKLKTENK